MSVQIQDGVHRAVKSNLSECVLDRPHRVSARSCLVCIALRHSVLGLPVPLPSSQAVFLCLVSGRAASLCILVLSERSVLSVLVNRPGPPAYAACRAAPGAGGLSARAWCGGKWQNLSAPVSVSACRRSDDAGPRVLLVVSAAERRSPIRRRLTAYPPCSIRVRVRPPSCSSWSRDSLSYPGPVPVCLQDPRLLGSDSYRAVSLRRRLAWWLPLLPL
jgi:hypothetical protein